MECPSFGDVDRTLTARAQTVTHRRAGAGRLLHVLEQPVEPVPESRPADIEWKPRPNNPHHARLYAVEDLYRFWVCGLGWFEIDPARLRLVVPPDVDPVLREQRIWGVPAILLLPPDHVSLHSSAVEVDGRALMFVAPGRFGKTTLAAAFHAQGHRLLTEDLTCVRVAGTPALLPGPPTLRLRPDVRDLLHLDDVVEMRRTDDRSHYLIDVVRRGDAAAVPLAGIVFLNAGSGGPTLSEVGGLERLPELWATAFPLASKSRGDRFAQLVDLVTSVPVWDLHREPTLAGLPALVDLLVRTCLA